MSIYFKTSNGMKFGPIDGDVTINIDDSEGVIIEEVSTDTIPFDTPTGEHTQSAEKNKCSYDMDELEFRYVVLQALSELLLEGKSKNARHRKYRKTERLLD